MSRHTIRIDEEAVADYLNSKDNKSAYVRKLIKADMKGHDMDMVGLEMQIQTLEKQAQSHAEQEEMFQERVEELRRLKSSAEATENRRLEEAEKELADTPKEPTNPAIQKWAEKVDLTPAELCDRLQQD